MPQPSFRWPEKEQLPEFRQDASRGDLATSRNLLWLELPPDDRSSIDRLKNALAEHSLSLAGLRWEGSQAGVLRKFIGEHISVGSGGVARKTIFMVQPAHNRRRNHVCVFGRR